MDRKLVSLKDIEDNNSDISIKNLIKIFKSLKKNIRLLRSEKQGIKIISEDKVFSKLHHIENLEYVLIANYSNVEKVSEILINNSWILSKKFINKKYGSTLFLFQKE